MNKISLIGRLTADPEFKYTPQQTPVASFTLAVTRPFSSTNTDFIMCVAWRKDAENISNFVKKGQRLGISGYLTLRKWQDKEGNNRYTPEVVVQEFDFIEPKGTSSVSTRPTPEETKEYYDEVYGDGDRAF